MIIFLLLLATAAAVEWPHLMTIDPNDGQITWHFSSEFWYTGDFGKNPDHDFINNTVRHYPIQKLKIEVTNGAGKVVTKTFTIDDAHRGWSFYDLMANGFNEEFTSETTTTGSTSGFENCPIMGIGGSLRANLLYAENGVRLLSSSQPLPTTFSSYQDPTYDNKVAGLGIDYGLRDGTSDDYNGLAKIENFKAATCRAVVSSSYRYKADANLKSMTMSGQGSDRGSVLNTKSDRFLYKLFVLPVEEPQENSEEQSLRILIEQQQSLIEQLQAAFEHQNKTISGLQVELEELKADLATSKVEFERVVTFSCSEEGVSGVRSLMDLYVTSSTTGTAASELISCLLKYKPWALMLIIPMD